MNSRHWLRCNAKRFKRILSWLPYDSDVQASVLKHFSTKGKQFTAIRAFLNINPIPLPGSPELKLYMETDDFKGHQISNMWSFIMAQRAARRLNDYLE